MTQDLSLYSASISRPPSAGGGDRVTAWLDDPARRLARMLSGSAGFSALCHVSLSVYDPATTLLWRMGLLGAVVAVEPQVIPSLVLLADTAEPRVVDDLADLDEDERHPFAEAWAAGCRSSMTVPLYQDGEFLGFVMYAARTPRFFDRQVREVLEAYTEAFIVLTGRARDGVSLSL